MWLSGRSLNYYAGGSRFHPQCQQNKEKCHWKDPLSNDVVGLTWYNNGDLFTGIADTCYHTWDREC